MKMASTGFALTVALILIGLGNADNFVELNCNEKQVAQIGQDSLLECVVKTSKEVEDLQIQSVQWTRYSADGSDPLVVLEYRDRRTHPIEGYSFAVPSWNTKNRNVSLLITKAAVEHVGHYECEVGTTSGYPMKPIMISFNVTAKYSELKNDVKPTENSKKKEDSNETESSARLEPAPAVQIVAPLVVIGSLLVGLLMAMLIYKVCYKKRYNVQFISPLDVEEGSHEYVKVSKPND